MWAFISDQTIDSPPTTPQFGIDRQIVKWQIISTLVFLIYFSLLIITIKEKEMKKKGRRKSSLTNIRHFTICLSIHNVIR